jgi:membrane fusion protein (multidrug efflux system)
MTLVDCKGFSRDKGRAETEVEAMSVEAAQPVRRTMAESVEVSGNLEPIEKADVYVQQSGIVREVFAKEGDRVKKGQLLAKIEDNEIALSYRQARNSFELLRDKYAKYQELYRDKMVSEQEFKELERSYHDAESNYKLYQLRLNNTELRSPLDGEVVAKSCEPHQFLGGMEKAFTVARLDQYKVVIYVTETALQRLKPGQDVELRIDAVDAGLDGYPHRGNISEIASQVDPSTGTAKVLVEIPAPPEGAKPGMFARLKIITALKPDVLTIPKKALAREEPPEVWVVKGDKVELRELQTGLSDESFLEILSGVSPDELVVTAGQEALSDKSRVRVVNSSNHKSGSTDSSPPLAGATAEPGKEQKQK